MKMKTLAATVILASSSSVALANSYQAEVGASFTIVDGADNGFGLRGEYHFAPVNPGNTNPLAEAAFMTRSSNVFAEGSDDLDLLAVGVEYYVPNTMFYVKGAVTNDRRGPSSDSGWFAQIGVMAIDNLLITTTLSDDDYDLNVQVKYVTDLGGGNFLNVEGAYTDSDFLGDVLALSADFYLDRTFSVGAGFSTNDAWDEFTLRARKFFNNELSAGIAYTDSDLADHITLDVAFRF